MRLFPYETAAFFRIAHGRELYERWRQTGVGAMLNDPEVAPLVGGIWSLVGDQFNERNSEEAGFEWADLDRIPQGEVAIGLIDRGDDNLGILLLADFDGAQENVDFLVEVLDQRWADRAMVVEEQEIGGETVTIVRDGDDRSSSFGYLIKDCCLIGSNDEVLLGHVLDRWAGRTPTVELTEEDVAESDDDTLEPGPLPGERSFAENPQFQTILKECSTQLEEPPQIVAYIDPILVVRRTMRGNVGASITLATFPALGLDGILSLGGTSSFATENWDTLMHMHLLLDNPRAGVLTLLRFVDGDITPPDYVPAQACNYGTTYLDPVGIYDRVIQLYDHFRYDGAFLDEVESGATNAWGVDFREYFIDNLSGRVTLYSGFDEPNRIQGEQHAICLELIDPEVGQELLDAIRETAGEFWEDVEFGGVQYYSMAPPWMRNMPEENRPFTPAVGILDNTLIVTMSSNVLEQMIEAHQDSRPRLSDSIEYKVIQSRVERLTRGKQMVGFLYNNPAETFRHWFETSQSDGTRSFLGTIGENSPFASNMLGVLEANELPEFDKLEGYFAPTGGYLLDTNTGLHAMMFNMGRELPEAEVEAAEEELSEQP
ncbi:hypothetical protein [Aeoliella mucimassa]|nr:hypothetical protein [Aeoliella mucimassa]